MTDRIRNMIAGTRALESRLTAAFEQAAQTVAGRGGATTLETIQQATDEIAIHVQPAGRGRHVFPFNSVCVTFTAAGAADQARFDAICGGPPTLRDRVLKRLEAAGCVAADLDLSVRYSPAPDPAWTRPDFHVALARLEAAARPSRTPPLRVELIVAAGTADRSAYSFSALPIAIGRGAEVRDSRHQLLRINHVAFTEGGDEITQSVSRRHARIELDPGTGRPRLIDDNSAQGTSVVRNGRGIAVPRGSRGLGLQSGDEIVIGQARLRVRVASA